MKLKSEEWSFLMMHGADRSIVCGRTNYEPSWEIGDSVTVAHPDVKLITETRQ